MGVFFGCDADVRGCEHQVEASAGRPSVDGPNDRFPDAGVVVAQLPVGAYLGAVNGPGKRPEDVLCADSVQVFFGNARRRRQVVAGTKMPVTGAGEYGDADFPVLPDVFPHLADLIRCLMVEDVALIGVVDRYVGDMAFFLVEDAHV